MPDPVETPKNSALIEYLKIFPALTWSLAALYVLYYFHQPIASMIERREFAEITAGPIQIKLVERAIVKIDPSSIGGFSSNVAFAPAIERFKRISDKVVGANVLWIDDKHPTQNLNERRILSAFGLRVDMARSTSEAVDLLKAASYELIITNMDRRNDDPAVCYANEAVKFAGCDLIRRVQNLSPVPPTIIYLNDFKPELGTPAYALGITNRFDHLIQFVFDGIERRAAL